MFEHWVKDQEENYELERMNAILTGSFTNPEAAKNMLKADNPDFISTDDDFARSLEMVKQDKIKKRLRRKITPSQNSSIVFPK